MKSFRGLGSATLIGSMPQTDRQEAIRLVLKTAPEIPAWPQLPIYPAEQMMAQYAEGLPGLVREESRQFVSPDTPEFEKEYLAFYEEYLAIEEGTLELDRSMFRMGDESSVTFNRFLETLEEAGSSFRAVKGQITGPFTFLSGIKDRDGRAILYDERYLDIVPKLIGLKARWQIGALKRFGVPVIIFLDEPGLAGFGSSAYITVTSEMVLQLLAEVIDAVHTAGGAAGIHVCANTDWALAFRSDLDVINFDSYGFFDKFALYAKECADFIGRGGNMAWGVVPTLDPDAIRSETAEGLAARWTEQMRAISAAGIGFDEILAHSLFTPSCGCGSLTEDDTAKALGLLRDLCGIIRQRNP